MRTSKHGPQATMIIMNKNKTSVERIRNRKGRVRFRFTPCVFFSPIDISIITHPRANTDTVLSSGLQELSNAPSFVAKGLVDRNFEKRGGTHPAARDKISTGRIFKNTRRNDVKFGTNIVHYVYNACVKCQRILSTFAYHFAKYSILSKYNFRPISRTTGEDSTSAAKLCYLGLFHHPAKFLVITRNIE
jgi:hypothetical protein